MVVRGRSSGKAAPDDGQHTKQQHCPGYGITEEATENEAEDHGTDKQEETT